MDNQSSFDLSKLRDNPFDWPATPDHPYLSSSFQEVLAALYYGLEYGNRILIVSAERGLGKTTLLRYLERRLRDRSPTLLLSPGGEDGGQMLRKMLAEIGGATTSDDLLTLREQVDFTLGRIGKADKPFTLLLDYDEDEKRSTLDALSLLATLESMEKGLLRVVVASCPAVAGALRGSGLADEILTLSSLTASEVHSYIDHRLRLVGWNGVSLFSARAYALIAAKSSGRPSTVNEICSKLLHNLPHLDGVRATGRIEEGVLDDFCVESLLAGQNLVEPIPEADHLINWATNLPNHRTTVLASIILMVIMAIAGLWYRNAVKAHLRKHVTAARALRSTPRLRHAAFRDVARGQLATASRATAESNGPTIKGIAAGSAINPVAGPTVEAQPASPLRSEQPTASAVASRMPAKAATVDVTSAHLADFARPVLSSSTRIPNKPQPYPIGGAGKPEQKVIKALPSGISVANTRSTSSSVALQSTRAPTGVVPSVPAREGKNSGSRAAHEMAAYNIRLGDGYMEVGDYDKARSSYSRAVGGAPDSKEALDRMRRAERAKAAEESVLR